jgi:purine-nucleoside phosphorylase
MSSPYDPVLRNLAQSVARERGIGLQPGVYVGVLGPSYETPAEIHMLDRIGADAVGMSTVPEVIAARARNLRVLGISTITNLAAGISPEKLSHEGVLAAGKQAGSMLTMLITGIVERI